MVSEPSLGVLEANVVGKVNPPSVESFIFTLVAPGNACDPCTLYVMVWRPPWFHPMLSVFCEVTANGPTVPLTFTFISSELF